MRNICIERINAAENGIIPFFIYQKLQNLIVSEILIFVADFFIQTLFQVFDKFFLVFELFMKFVIFKQQLLIFCQRLLFLQHLYFCCNFVIVNSIFVIEVFKQNSVRIGLFFNKFIERIFQI